MSMSPSFDKVAAAAAALAGARPPGPAFDAPPADLAPADDAEAWAIHQACVSALGPVVAWKTGAPTPDATPMRGEITAGTMHQSPATLPSGSMRLWAVEAEIAVTIARDLPAQGSDYAAEEVLAAVASWHAAIEVLDSAFADWKATPAPWKVADRQSHGALIIGPGASKPPSGPLDQAPVRLLVDGAVAYEHRGGNTGGDPVRLLVALVNQLAGTARPIKAGDVVTTGSTTPFHRLEPGQRVRVEFEGLAPAELVVGA